MLNTDHTEKKIRECLLDLRNHSRNPRHLEEIGYLIRENLNRVKNSKKRADTELRKLPKKDVEIIENLLSCIKKTEEKKNDYVDLNKREKKFKKTFDKDRKSKKQTRISRDAGSKQAASEMSSDKELVVLHKRPPKLKKHFRKQKAVGNVHSNVKAGSLSNVLCMPATGSNEVKDKTLKANKSQTSKDLKNSANNSVKSEVSLCKGKIRNRIDDIGLDSLVSELDTAVNLSKIILKQLGGINKKDITSDATGDFLNKCFPNVISDCLVDSKCVNIKEEKTETTDEKNLCGVSLSKCSQEFIHSDDKRNSSDSRKYSKQSIAGDERISKKKVKKENSNLLDELKSVPKTSNTDSKVSKKDLPNNSRKSKRRRGKDGMKNSDASKSTLSSSDPDRKTKEKNFKKDRAVLSDKTIAILKAKSKSRLQTSSGSVSEDKSREWSFVNDNKMKSKHIASKVKLSRHSINNCKTSSFKNSEINCRNNYKQLVDEEGFVNDLKLKLKRNKPCTNFQLSDTKISLDCKTGNENDTNFSSLHESVCNSSEVKSVIQRDEVNLSKLEQKSTRSSKDRIDISINKSTKNSIDNVLSVVIKHKKSVQSSRITRKGNKFSNVYLSANKTNNTESFTIVPQSYKIEEDSYTICKNSIQSRCFGSNYSESISKTPLVSNTTTKVKDSELKSSTYGEQISEYRSNQSALKQEVFRRPHTQRVNFFGKNLSRRKFKNKATMNARENLKYINKDYISVASVRVPINFGNINTKKLQQKSNTKLRMVRKKSSSNIGRYFYPKRNDLLENSVSVPNKVQYGENIHRRKCNFPLGKFFFHIDLESKSGVESRNCGSGDSESKFFTIIDDSSETFQMDGARAVENDARVLQKQPVRLQEIKNAECLEKEKSNLNAENVSSRIDENDEKLSDGIGNSFFTVVEENNFNKPESKTRVIKKCNFNSPELEKHNFVHVIDEIVDENELKKTLPIENVNISENKQNISGEAMFATFSDMFFEKYKNQFFMKVVDSKSEVEKPICPMVDAEIQTDSSFITLQQLFAEELKHNRNLFIKNLDEPNSEENVKNMQTHYEDILELVDNLFEITLNKIGCVDDEVLKKTESNTTPENDIISKLNNIVEIVQNIDKNKLSEPNFVKVIESGNALDVRKEPEDFDKPSASQTNGSGDCMSVPLMKSQLLLNQFNIYLEMVEMLKNHEDVSSDKIESLNEIRKVIDRIAGANTNCERSFENQRSTHDLGPYSLTIKRDCRLPLVENRSNFVNVVEESRPTEETKTKTICRNQIMVDPVYPEIEKKNPFFVVVDKNVSNSSIDRKDVGSGETSVEYGKHCRSISPDKSKNNRNKRIPNDQYYLLDESITSTEKNPFFVVVDENDTSTSNRVGEEEENVKKACEITDRKLNTEFVYKQNPENSENFCYPKCDGIKVRKQSSSSLTIKNMYREQVKTVLFHPEKPEIRQKENVEKEFFNIVNSLTYLNGGNDLNELLSNGDKNNKIKEIEAPVVDRNVDNSVSIGIQTDSPTVQEEQKTAVEHCENSIHLDMLNKQVSREQGNIQNSIDHARFKEDKSVNVIFSKNTQKNEHNKTESRNITSQTSSTFVLNSKANNCSDCKGFENERRHDETFENSKFFNSKETDRHKHTKNNQRNNVYFNSCFKKRHYNSENLNSSHVLKTENMIPDFKMKTAVDEYSKWINSSEQNRIDFKNMFTDYQNDDCFSFDLNEYKHEICLNEDLSYSDLDVTDEEEDSSNWLTVENINCIQSTDDSSESIDKKIMRLQMDLHLNECLQIELSSDSTFDTFL